jgi:hypothetical protein
MSNRNFDSRVIIQRLQEKNYARNLYQVNMEGLRLVSNPQNSSGDSSQYNTFTPGSQTAYFRGLIGSGETIDTGGIVNISPFVPTPTPSIVITSPSVPTIISITGTNNGLTVNFSAPTSDGGSNILNYDYSTDNGTNWVSAGTTNSPILITGLNNGTTYSVTIRAVNIVGAGTASTSQTGTPTATIQTFTTPLDTAIAWLAPTDVYSVEYLVVGGGGGGGGAYDTGGGGGGGAGMVLTGIMSVIPDSNYTVTVGSGGSASTNNYPTINETDGGSGNSSIFNTITAFGGEGGKRSRYQIGGSGLGGAAQSTNITSARAGNGGGANGGGGGGGGSNGSGANKVGATGGNGGVGITTSISGVTVTYSTGGKGGNGSVFSNGNSGTSNTGNGASGAGASSGGARNGGTGGSGIVILKY